MELGGNPARSLSLNDLRVKSSKINKLDCQTALKMGLGSFEGGRRDPSLRSGFRQRAPAPPPRHAKSTRAGDHGFAHAAKRLNRETAPIRSQSPRATVLKSMDFDTEGCDEKIQCRLPSGANWGPSACGKIPSFTRRWYPTLTSKSTTLGWGTRRLSPNR